MARAWIGHAEGDLFVSVTGLPRTSNGTAHVGLGVDVYASSHDRVQPSDVGFFIDESGVAFQMEGRSQQMMLDLSPEPGFSARVSRGPQSWSAEVRIADGLVAGWNHAAGIILSATVPESDDGPLSTENWPASSDLDRPSTWANAFFGEPPGPENRRPTADAGPDQFLRLTRSAPTGDQATEESLTPRDESLLFPRTLLTGWDSSG